MPTINDDPTTLNPNARIYYSSVYWNSYDYVWQRLNRRISGEPHTHWFKHFHARVGYRRFKKALILCSGNGWVERELFAYGLFNEAVGVDYLDPLLAQARRAASDLPLRYYQMDINTAAFWKGGYDLVINYAAAHHIAYLDRVFRALTRLLPPDGYFVSYDYIGPHRNQYPVLQWAAVHDLNQTLPRHLQQELVYPHLPTMLRLDPTEAIHSELILPVMRRYFAIEEHHHLGGALSYPILTHNEPFHHAPASEQQVWLHYIVEADDAYLAAFPDSSLFDYVVARPYHAVLQDDQKLRAWTTEETQREQLAHEHGGVYYPRIQGDQADARLVAELQAECAWRRETMDNLFRERTWLLERNRALEVALQQWTAHPAVNLLRRIKHLLHRE